MCVCKYRYIYIYSRLEYVAAPGSLCRHKQRQREVAREVREGREQALSGESSARVQQFSPNWRWGEGEKDGGWHMSHWRQRIFVCIDTYTYIEGCRIPVLRLELWEGSKRKVENISVTYLIGKFPSFLP